MTKYTVLVSIVLNIDRIIVLHKYTQWLSNDFIIGV